MAAQVEKLTAVSKELGRKHKVCQFQLHALTDERADLLAHLQDQQREINALKQELGHAQNDNADLAKSHVSYFLLMLLNYYKNHLFLLCYYIYIFFFLPYICH